MQYIDFFVVFASCTFNTQKNEKNTCYVGGKVHVTLTVVPHNCAQESTTHSSGKKKAQGSHLFNHWVCEKITGGEPTWTQSMEKTPWEDTAKKTPKMDTIEVYFFEGISVDFDGTPKLDTLGNDTA